jgi:hypothetical protein
MLRCVVSYKLSDVEKIDQYTSFSKFVVYVIMESGFWCTEKANSEDFDELTAMVLARWLVSAEAACRFLYPICGRLSLPEFIVLCVSIRFGISCGHNGKNVSYRKKTRLCEL